MDNIPDIAIFEDRVIEPAVLQGLRPTAEVLASSRLTVARYNENVPRTDFSLEGMSLNSLVSVNLPFDPMLFRVSVSRAEGDNQMTD